VRGRGLAQRSYGRFKFARTCFLPVLAVLLVLAGILGPAETPEHIKVKALVIGNGRYEFLQPVPAAEAGADAMARALREQHFEVLEKTNLTLGVLRQTIEDEWIPSLRPGDVPLVYYSGYGLQRRGDNYLVPVDFNTNEQSDPNSAAYLILRLQLKVDQRQPKAEIFLLEASWQNDALTNWSGFAGLAPFSSTSPGTYLVADAAANHSITLTHSGVGLFTEGLIHALHKQGLTLAAAIGEVLNEVSAASGNSQFPYPLGTAELVLNPAPPPPPAPPPKIVAPALKAGAVRKNSKDNLEYAFIPRGTFMMGCTPGDHDCAADELPAHQVTISHDFWITRTEVSVKAYEIYTKANGLKLPRHTQTNPQWRYTDRPISMLNWDAAEKFCVWAGGRLPTEAEWEYAARGGKTEIYPWGDKFVPANARSIKNPDNRFPEEVPIDGFYPPYGYGLFNMAGNVREWTSDVYNATAYKRPGPSIDPAETEGGNDRVVRGGSFYDGPKNLRISARDHVNAVKEVSSLTGFRCVLPQLAAPDGR
jgi:formylglycine-generating enzyme required for sulfatase activity